MLPLKVDTFFNDKDFFDLQKKEVESFLDASTHLYMRLCRSVGPSVRRSVGPWVGPSVRRFSNIAEMETLGQ